MSTPPNRPDRKKRRILPPNREIAFAIIPAILSVLLYVFVAIPLANRLFSLEIIPGSHDTLVAFLIGMSVGLWAALRTPRKPE